MKICSCIDEYSLPIFEFFILTGIIPSEGAALKKAEIGEELITIREGYVPSYGKTQLKTGYRLRIIPITKAIRARLDILMPRKGEYLLAGKDGKRYDHESFKEQIWEPALVKAEIEPRRVPYCWRHTFIMWAQVVGVDLMNLYRLAGHTDVSMIHKNYTRQVKKLASQRQIILGIMGEDFVRLSDEVDLDEIEFDL